MRVFENQAAESELHRDARRLLERESQRVGEILRVDPDAVLFRSPDGQVRTAWLYRVGGHTRAFVEPGMPAYPSVPLPPSAEPASEVAADPDQFPESD